MSDKERLEFDALLAELGSKIKEAGVIHDRLKFILNPASGEVRKKPSRRPQDYRREVMQ